MYGKSEICKKIHGIYPEMGECDMDLNVAWDDENSAWAVDFEKNGQPIRHFLEDEDASNCVEDDFCVGLGIEFGQF